LGEEQAARYQKILSPDEPISWYVYLPNNNSTVKPGVMVYISPGETGQIDSRWRSVMDQQNMIYIAANDSGNRRRVNRRMVLAVMAIKALAQQHSFATDHIIVAGFSGGGRVASKLASQYPEVFTGALYICGVDYWKKDQTSTVDRLLQNKFVFLTGSRDFNRDETKRIYRRYIKAGAQ
jgi:predicted esterase